jgi:predicted dehydrogenase
MGSAEWDIHAGNVVVYLHGRSDPIVYPAPPGYELGQMYLDEMEYFLSCLERSEKPFSDPLEGLLAVKVVEAAKESSKSERKVSLSGGDKP